MGARERPPAGLGLSQPSSTRPTSGPSSLRERRDRPGRASRRCVAGAPARSRSSCSNAIGRQRSSTIVCGSAAAIVRGVDLEMLGPQAQPGRAGEVGVVGDDVHLGVVEQRVGVQVRRPDGQPAVVDDPDLGVHVQTIDALAGPGPERGGEQASGPVVGHGQHPELPERVVLPVVRLRRQHDHDPEFVARRVSQLVGEQAGDLRRPQELVLEVDEALGAGDRANVALEDPVLAVRDRVVHAVGDRPHDLDRVLAGVGRGRRAVQRLPGQLAPAQREVIVDVGDRGAAQARPDVVPAEPAPRRVVARVEPVAGVVGHVDSADERELAVDDHGLLVVAVERMLAGVGLAADPGIAG